MALLAAAALLAGAASAGAHTTVARTDPQDGASLAQAPAVVRVLYAAPLAGARAARISVEGTARPVRPRLDPRTARRVLIPLPAGVGGAGAYRVTWSVVGTDGHRLGGTIAFSVRESPYIVALHEIGATIAQGAAAAGAAIAAAAGG